MGLSRTVTRIQDQDNYIGGENPTDGNVLFWNRTASPPAWDTKPIPAAPVTSVFGRTGAVVLLSGDVLTALGYTPRDAAAATVNTFNTRSGAVVLSSGDVTTALTFTPENTANKGNASGYASLDSGGKVPTSQLPASILGALEYQGTWNATTNSPTLAGGVGTKGFYYKVSVAGSTSIDGISVWNIGDWIVFNGTVWDKVDNFESITSVFGRVGAVVLLSGDVTGALGFTPRDAATTTVNTFNTRSGAVVLSSSDVTTALGFTPPTNVRLISAGNGLSGGGDLTADRTLSLALTGALVNAALGYTAANAASIVTAHSGLSGLTLGDDHSQYALLAGRSVPQALNLGILAGATAGYISSTSHATKGSYGLNATGTIMVDEANVAIKISGLPLISGPGAFNPSTIANLVSRVRADDLAGADGTAVITWAQTAGTAPSATGTGTLKIAGNGINGHNVVRFNGSSDKFTMTTGGASLTGDWYVAAVCKFAVGNVYQNVISWGDQVTQKRRSMMRLSSADTNANDFAFVINSSANLVGTTLTAATAYLLEMQSQGGVVTLWVNGVWVASAPPNPAIIAYSSTAIVLGVNPAGSEFLNGDIAEIVMIGTAAPAVRLQLQSYFNMQYGLGLNLASHTKFATSNASLVGGAIAEDTNNSLYAPAITVDQTSVFNSSLQSRSLLVSIGSQFSVGANSATASINGLLVAKSATYEHQFILNAPSQTGQYDANVMAIQHLYTGGVSGIRCRDNASSERMAVGYGNSGLSSTAPAFASRAFIEVSNIPNGGSAGLPGSLVIVQSGTVNSLANNNYVRYELKGDGSHHWYNLATPGSEVDWLTIDNVGLVSVSQNLAVSSAGKGLQIKEGSNCKQGTATLVAGTVTVSNTSVTANSRIFLGVQSLGTVSVPSGYCVSARTAGTSFTILASVVTDTSVIAYEIFEPA